MRRVWGTRASAVGHGIEAGNGNDVTGPEMTSWQPEMTQQELTGSNKILMVFYMSISC